MGKAHRTIASLLLSSLLAASPARAELITLDQLPVINQHNAAFDRDAADGNQNGELWCAPVAAVSALLWLAKTYERPDVVPKGPGGARMTPTNSCTTWEPVGWKPRTTPAPVTRIWC